jgi:hypothetical protein
MTKFDKDISNPRPTRLVVVGDSWTYGSEIRDPILPETVKDWDKENDNYRTARIWPTKLAEFLGVKDLVNLSYPAASNDKIVRNLIGWLTQEYFNDNRPTDDLFVAVGFTSPERKDFYYKNNKTGFWFTVWPMWRHLYPQPELNEFSEIYMTYLFNQEESTHRYLNQVFYLQTVLNHYKIKHIFFQSFYQRKDLHIRQWIDDPYARHYNGQPDQMIWNMIDPVSFIHKDQEIHSFHNYILQFETNENKVIQGQHPNEYGHTLWAEHIFQYIVENKLC